MSVPLSCFYIDEPLNQDELAFAIKTLLGPWARFKTGATELVHRRVPFVLTTPDAHGQYAGSREHRAQQVISNLRRAGIRNDVGRSVVWAPPRDISWDAIFQYAIRSETGYGPYVVQRWFPQDGLLVRGPVRIIDTEMLLQGL